MFTIDKKAKNFSLSLMGIGLIAMVYGFMTDSHGAWPSLLFNTYFFLGISVFAVFFVALQYVAEAGWSIVLKRVPEAIMTALPVFSLIMLFIMVASIMHWNHIYHWLHEGIMDPTSHHYDKIIAGKEPYLNAAFFIIRTIIYLLGWNYFAKKLRALSILEDKEGGTAIHFKGVRSSAWFMVFFAITSAMASWDWIMSVDPHWFSTLFGWYVFASMLVSGITVIALITIYLKSKGLLEFVNDSHLHDLAKFMFGISIFWTYLWFSQFMLIWYSNIPEEVVYFVARIEDYKLPFFGMVAMNFVFPLLLLMNSDYKRIPWFVVMAGIVILCGHYLDVFNMIMPATVSERWFIGAPEIGAICLFGGLFLFLVFYALSKHPLLPKGNPFIKESEHFHY